MIIDWDTIGFLLTVMPGLSRNVVIAGLITLPAVVATSDTTGPWDRPGSAHVVHLADGSTLR